MTHAELNRTVCKLIIYSILDQTYALVRLLEGTKKFQYTVGWVEGSFPVAGGIQHVRDRSTTYRW